MDRTLPVELRLCDACTEVDLSVRMCPARGPEDKCIYTDWGYKEPAPDPREDHRVSLRAGLVAALREFGTRWPFCEFGKAAVGEMFLSALEAVGADRAAELDAALAALSGEEYGRLRVYVSGLPEAQGGSWPEPKPTRKARPRCRS